MVLNDSKSSSNSKINDPAPRGRFLCGYMLMHFMADTLKTLSKKTTPKSAFATITKYGFDPRQFPLPRRFRGTFRAPSPVQCYSASCWEPTPDMRTSGFPLQEQSKIQKMPIFSHARSFCPGLAYIFQFHCLKTLSPAVS